MHEQQSKRDNPTDILTEALQRIKGSNSLKRRLRELYEPIVKQYYKIQHTGDFHNEFIQNTAWEYFPKLLENSLRLIAGNRRLRLATKTLNSVAKIWDKDVRKSPSERSHLFFFCSADVEVDNDASNTIYTRMFYDFAPPDHRLICIFLPVGAKYTQLDFYETLHEAGHFIGRRIRKERIALFREAVVAEFCNQVYLHTMQEALHEPTIQNIHPNIEEDIYYAKQLRKLSFSARKSVTELFHNLKLSSESKEYTDALKAMDSAIDAGYEIKGYIDRAKNALANGYFSFATPVVLYALQSKLSTQKDDVAESIKAAFEKVSAELNECLSNPEASIPLWVKICERQYQEPAADLFMICITKMNAQKYMRFALTTTYNCWARLRREKPGLTFLQHLSNDEVFPKYVGILCSAFSEDCDRIIDGSHCFKARCFPRTRNKSMKAELERGYNLIRQAITAYQAAKPSAVDESDEKDQAVLLTIFNPIHRVYSYMSKVQDRFWKRYPASTSTDGSATAQNAQETEENVDPIIRKKLERLIRSVVIIREYVEIK